MKNSINKKPKKSTCFLLKNTTKVINNNFSDFSVSISGEFTFTNPTILYRRFYSSDLEMF
jgi:hypothetical protein